MRSPKRVRIDWRKPGGKKPENVVVVARPSRFGNAFRVGREVKTNIEAVNLYREWVMGDSIGARLVRGAAMKNLRGKDLACYCDLDAPCHADVLLEIANSA